MRTGEKLSDLVDALMDQHMSGALVLMSLYDGNAHSVTDLPKELEKAIKQGVFKGIDQHILQKIDLEKTVFGLLATGLITQGGPDASQLKLGWEGVQIVNRMYALDRQFPASQEQKAAQLTMHKCAALKKWLDGNVE